MKAVKVKLKALHREEFSGITDRITKARDDLQTVQTLLQTDASQLPYVCLHA